MLGANLGEMDDRKEHGAGDCVAVSIFSFCLAPLQSSFPLSFDQAYPQAEYLIRFGTGGQINEHPAEESNIQASSDAYSQETGDFLLPSLDDGSPSTKGVGGVYTGNVVCEGITLLPHLYGAMAWDNGITYKGFWFSGKYHGQGTKMYSRGGGFVGNWKHGLRHGKGVSLYNGKWGYDRWEGSFENDLPHGPGLMYMNDAKDPVPFVFLKGEPVP